jgi:hypothetical protein
LNTSIILLRVAGGGEKGIQWLGVYLGNPVAVGYKYRILDHQVEESRAFVHDRRVLSSEGAPHIKPAADSNRHLGLGPRRGLTPRQTGRLSVGVIITLNFKNGVFWDVTDSCHSDEGGAKFLRNVSSYKSHTA